MSFSKNEHGANFGGSKSGGVFLFTKSTPIPPNPRGFSFLTGQKGQKEKFRGGGGGGEDSKCHSLPPLVFPQQETDSV